MKQKINFKGFFLVLITLLPVLTFAQKVRSVEKCHQFLKDVPVNCLLADNAEKLWVGTHRGLYVFNSFEGVRTMHEEGAVTAIAMDHNIAWSALASGKIISSDRSKSFNLKGAQISSMKIKGNELWIGTRKQGVFVYNTSTMQLVEQYKKSNSNLRSNEVNFIHLDRSNALWVGTSLGVCHIMNNVWKLHKSNSKMTAAVEKNGEVWLMSHSNLWKIKEGNWDRVVLRRGATKGKVNNMYFDDNGRLYLASDIFSRYDLTDKSVKQYNKKTGYTQDKTLCIGIDSEGDVWAGTAKKGLFRFNVITEEINDSTNVFTLNNLFFEDDSYELTYQTKMELNKLIGYLKQNSTFTIEINGYTNGLPDNEYCEWLSTWRAKKVYEYVSAYGISKTRLKYNGFGKNNPMATDEAKERNMNQRVEIRVTRNTSLVEY